MDSRGNKTKNPVSVFQRDNKHNMNKTTNLSCKYVYDSVQTTSKTPTKKFKSMTSMSKRDLKKTKKVKNIKKTKKKAIKDKMNKKTKKTKE